MLQKSNHNFKKNIFMFVRVHLYPCSLNIITMFMTYRFLLLWIYVILVFEERMIRRGKWGRGGGGKMKGRERGKEGRGGKGEGRGKNGTKAMQKKDCCLRLEKPPSHTL